MGLNGDELLACGPDGQQPLDEPVDAEAGRRRQTEQQNSDRIAALEIEHEELVVKRRKLEDTQIELLAEQRQLMVNAGPVATTLREAESTLKSARVQAPNAKFAGRAEIQAHEERVADAQKSVAEATARHTEHNAKVVKWRSAETENREERQKLDRQIEETWHALQTMRGVKTPPLVEPSSGADQ